MATDFSLTAYVARFIVDTPGRRIPRDVMHLGKRSILDGLALAGNMEHALQLAAKIASARMAARARASAA